MSDGQSAEVLLVEDNATDAELALRALREGGFSNPVEVVRDGAAALERLLGPEDAPDPGTAGIPKLVLLDLRLPRMSGLEVLRRIKSHQRTRTVPVVVLTSSREDTDIRRCYELGANSYVVKPVEFESFANAVSQVSRYWLTLNQLPPADRG